MARHDMSTPATYDDVTLILRLYELRREDKLREARAWFVANFAADSIQDMAARFPPHSDENRMARMVSTHWEMVASFLVSGVLNQELFFQSGREMLLVWTRIKHLVPDMRQQFNDPSLYRNLEQACHSYIEYLNQSSPQAYPSFESRVNNMVKR